MATFARVVLVCILVSTGLLKHTLSRPSVPEEDEEYNEIDFEDQIPFGKDVVDDSYRFDEDDEDDDFDEERDIFMDALEPGDDDDDDDESDDFDEERDIFKDALGPDNEDEEDYHESNVESEDYSRGGDDQLHQDDNVDEMDSEEKEETDENDESGIEEAIPLEEHEIKVDAVEESVVEDDADEDDENPGFGDKVKNFLRSITSFLLILDRDKN